MKTYTNNRPRLRKSYAGTPATVKKGRTVTAVVSVFDVVDVQGDRVRKGAFKNSIAEWMSSDRRLPVVWSHKWDDPYQHVGWVSSMRETAEGLEVDMVFDESDFAERVLKLIKEKRVNEYSFAYDVVRETKARDGANELIELDLIEVGPTLKGANPATHTVSTKAAKEFYEQARADVTTVTQLPNEPKSEEHDDVLDAFWGLRRHATPSTKSDEDLRRALDSLEFGDLAARERAANADVFIASVQGAIRRAREDEATRQRRIAATTATPAEDAPRIRADMTPIDREVAAPDQILWTETLPVWSVASDSSVTMEQDGT